MYTRRGWWIAKFVVFGVLMVVLLGLVTQFLWNFIMPDIFGLPMINFWQGLAMFVLSKLIFGFGSSGRNKWRTYQNQKHWVDKYSKLSPEERDRIKQKMKEKWCSWEESSVKEPQVKKDPQ